MPCACSCITLANANFESFTQTIWMSKTLLAHAATILRVMTYNPEYIWTYIADICNVNTRTRARPHLSENSTVIPGAFQLHILCSVHGTTQRIQRNTNTHFWEQFRFSLEKWGSVAVPMFRHVQQPCVTNGWKCSLTKFKKDSAYKLAKHAGTLLFVPSSEQSLLWRLDYLFTTHP